VHRAWYAAVYVMNVLVKGSAKRRPRWPSTRWPRAVSIRHQHWAGPPPFVSLHMYLSLPAALAASGRAYVCAPATSAASISRSAQRTEADNIARQANERAGLVQGITVVVIHLLNRRQRYLLLGLHETGLSRLCVRVWCCLEQLHG
jgi:hypothetical protein